MIASDQATEWFTSTDPHALLPLVKQQCGRFDDRKLRLWACAFCRRIWHLLECPASRRVVEANEHFADTEIDFSNKDWAKEPEKERIFNEVRFADEFANQAVENFHNRSPIQHVVMAAAQVAIDTSFPEHVENSLNDPSEDIGLAAAAAIGWHQAASDEINIQAAEQERHAQADLLRDIIRNPFEFHEPFSLSWRTPTVLALAEATYEHRDLPAGTLDPVRLAVLADAIEEAGSTDQPILDHLRQPSPHVRGCWALDCILDKFVQVLKSPEKPSPVIQEEFPF
jgi:hypothetical protein